MSSLVLIACSILDTKVGTFSPPFFAGSTAAATRTVSDAMHGDSMLARHPGDFQLFRVGTFNSENGALVPCVPESLGSLIALLPKPAGAPLVDMMEGKVSS